MAYFEGRTAWAALAAKRLDHGILHLRIKVSCFSGIWPIVFVMKHLNKLRDRAELIEPWVGLGLTLATFDRRCCCCRFNCGAPAVR